MTRTPREVLDQDDADLRVKADEIEVDDEGKVVIKNKELGERIKKVLNNGDAEEIAGIFNGGCSCNTDRPTERA